jgi:hypothetical protein
MDGPETGPDRETGDTKEAGKIRRVAEQTKEALGRAKDSMSAGASGLKEYTKDALGEAREQVVRAAEVVRNAETDRELRGTVSATTEQSLHRAGDAVGGAAPAIGRGAEYAASKVGSVLHIAARPLAVVLGAIAGVVGGWWKEASSSVPDFPESEDQACRAHFAAITVVPEGMTYDRARNGYALGYIAARNPGYRGRPFDDVELDLRQGFTGERTDEFDALREFARYGYTRGSGGGF